MKPTPDATPNQTQVHLQVLKDIANGKHNDLCSPIYAAKITDVFRQQLRQDLGESKSFVFLGKEKITRDHFMLDTTADEIFHYKMVLAKRTLYFHFRFNTEQKIGWISFEE